MVKYGCLFYMLEMLIARHLGTPNSVFLLATECVIQYYTDQWYAALGLIRGLKQSSPNV